MAMIDNIGPLMGLLGKTLISILTVLFICGIIVMVFYLWMKNKQYKKYKVLIYKRKRNQDGTKTLVFVGTDKAAIKYDRKLKRRYFHLKKNNVHLGEEETDDLDENRELDVPSIPSESGGETVFLEKLGPKKFAFGDPNIIHGEVKVIVSEADSAEATRAYDINAKLAGKDGWKWAGPIAFAVFAVLIVVLIAVVLQKFEILQDVVTGLDKVSQTLMQGRSAAVPTNVP